MGEVGRLGAWLGGHVHVSPGGATQLAGSRAGRATRAESASPGGGPAGPEVNNGPGRCRESLRGRGLQLGLVIPWRRMILSRLA